MSMNKEQALEQLLNTFPELEPEVREEFALYESLLAHVFFPDLLFHTEAIPDLLTLLKTNQNPELIQKYCDFLQLMYSDGDSDVQNVLVVSILERLSDDREIWFHFGDYIPNDFRRFINTDVIPNNGLMMHVPPLPYSKPKHRKKGCRM